MIPLIRISARIAAALFLVAVLRAEMRCNVSSKRKETTMLTQLQQFELARRKIAAANQTFMELVNHPTNPMTREDLAANIARRPELWSRFAGFLDKLPSRQ